MDCSRHPPGAPLAVAPLVAILLLMPSLPARADDESGATTIQRIDHPQSLPTSEDNSARRPAGSRHNRWTPTDRDRSAEDWEAPRRYRSSRHAADGADGVYGTAPQVRGFRPNPLLVLAAATVFLFLAVWRGPSSSSSPENTARPVASPQSVICLACRRCGRVVDIPGERMQRHLFCPRCGATLPRDV